MQSGITRNSTIDVLRLILSILVVSIHTMALYSVGEMEWVLTSLGIARIAVPFFFIVTGYFFYNKIRESKSNEYIIKLFLFYITWVIIEIIFLMPRVIVDITNNMTEAIVKILMVGVTGSLWYVSSMLLALVIVKPFLKRNMFNFLFIISVVFFVIGLGGDSYYHLVEPTLLGYISRGYTNIFGMSNIGFTFSIPFVVLGAAINKYKLKDKIKIPGLISILGLGLLLFEVITLFNNKIPKDYNMYVSLLIAVPAIFIWSLNLKINISNKVGKICREYSIGIYCTHQTLMLYCFTFINSFMQFSIERFFITLGVAILVTSILIRFKITRKYLLLS